MPAEPLIARCRERVKVISDRIFLVDAPEPSIRYPTIRIVLAHELIKGDGSYQTQGANKIEYGGQAE